MARLLVLAAALLGTLLAGAAPASAHAALTGSDPKAGAVVAVAPQEIGLTFSEQVAMSPDSIRVLDPSGRRADTGEIINMCSGSLVKYGVALRAGLPDGTYTVAWQTVSADSHPIAGAFTFSVGAPSATSVALPEQTPGGGVVGALYGIARYLSYAGFAVLVGGGAFVLLCWPRGAGVRPVQRTVVRGWLALTGATLAMLLLRGPYTGSGKLADVFDLAGLQTVLQTKTGAALTSRLLLLGAAALFVAVLFGAYARRTDPKERKDLAFGLGLGGTVVAAGIAGTWALAEHASTGLQPGVAMPVDILHLLAVAAWLGGLTTLLVALHREPSVERAAVERFSRVALASVTVLVATGLYQSWRQVGSWSALTGTRYGQLLLVKIGLMAVLVGIAWISRRWTRRLTDRTPQTEAETDTEAGSEAEPDEEEREEQALQETLDEVIAEETDPERAAQLARQRTAMATARRKKARDADAERTGLRRSVLTEAAVAVVLLAVTTVLTSTEPGRTEEQLARTGGTTAGPAAVPDRPVDIRLPFDTGGENGKGVVQLTLDPGRTGANALHLFVERPNGKPLDVPEVKVNLTLEEKGVGPLPVAPDRIQTGHWTASGVQLPLPGDWRIQVTVRTSEIDQTTIEKNVRIG
ncbi:copper resistance protein CopC [Streptomyces sp. CC208A]|uniref:copper resistance CopC/CopD family protein n=1 Tax=Streptomyces sp. CC208A TaxID=3044573 RepID=UPI0024A91954|nr:copper resistance protein CopC [Streptomyces sp. CC208A]